MTVLAGVISYPVPLYQNLPIHAEYYVPDRFVISAITLGPTTTITTTVVHNYVIGQEVRLIIPPTFGCRQLNEQTGFVISIPSTTQVELNIYSAGGDAFIAATATIASPQILAIGDINLGATNSSGRINTSTFIPGSFINISPL